MKANRAIPATCFFSLLLAVSVLGQPCVPVPSGIVGWWQGETNALDSAGTNNGILQGSVGFAPGEVGQAFVIDGSGATVEVLANPNINVGAGNGFTIEL